MESQESGNSVHERALVLGLLNVIANKDGGLGLLLNLSLIKQL